MDTVYKHLKIQNRPYSVNDIVLNLHNEFGKSAVQKAIDHLLAEGKIFEKVSGFLNVYCNESNCRLICKLNISYI